MFHVEPGAPWGDCFTWNMFVKILIKDEVERLKEALACVFNFGTRFEKAFLMMFGRGEPCNESVFLMVKSCVEPVVEHIDLALDDANSAMLNSKKQI